MASSGRYIFSDKIDSRRNIGEGGTDTEWDVWVNPSPVIKGVLMQRRDKRWSRWKERYVILTRYYLIFFRRSSGVTFSEMGSYIFKLRLAEVEGIRWEIRQNGFIVAIVLPQEPKIYLRVPDQNNKALHQWYTLLHECFNMSKDRRQALCNHRRSTDKTLRHLKESSPPRNLLG